jgi:hypothetical protein
MGSPVITGGWLAVTKEALPGAKLILVWWERASPGAAPVMRAVKASQRSSPHGQSQSSVPHAEDLTWPAQAPRESMHERLIHECICKTSCAACSSSVSGFLLAPSLR